MKLVSVSVSVSFFSSGYLSQSQILPNSWSRSQSRSRILANSGLSLVSSVLFSTRIIIYNIKNCSWIINESFILYSDLRENLFRTYGDIHALREIIFSIWKKRFWPLTSRLSWFIRELSFNQFAMTSLSSLIKKSWFFYSRWQTSHCSLIKWHNSHSAQHNLWCSWVKIFFSKEKMISRNACISPYVRNAFSLKSSYRKKPFFFSHGNN